VLAGLARLGEVELFTLVSRERIDEYRAPPDVSLGRVGVAEVPAPTGSLLRRMRWLFFGRLPAYVAHRDFGEVRAAFRGWAADHYDLVWFSRAESYVALGPCVRAPLIVDFDDLEDYKIAARQAAWPLAEEANGRALPRIFGRWIGWVGGTRSVRLIREHRQTILAAVRAAVVCSEQDRQRLQAAHVRVIPNGYAYPVRPVGRPEVQPTPVIVIPGSLTYGPNIDAAHYFIVRILPLLRRRLPAVRVRLVGQADRTVQRLHRPPAVTVTGVVPDITAELAGADLIAVPIRFGGGTRIKVLEAFAHRIPLVSTPAGVEGIEAAGGRELLIADTPADFAAACFTLLTDLELRRALVEAGHALYLERYRWDRIQEQIASLGAVVAASGETGRPRAADP